MEDKTKTRVIGTLVVGFCNIEQLPNLALVHPKLSKDV